MILPAISVQHLTLDIHLVGTKISGMIWRRGFTNMAQRFITINGMFSRGSRESAQGAVHVITDGKYPFEYQTAGKARELKDSAPDVCS